MACSITSWAVLCVVAWAAAAPSQSQRADGSSKSSEKTAGADDWSTDASVHSTAEDVLAALQKLRPRNEPIAPAGRSLRGAIEDRAKLWPEGTRLTGRTGRLIPDEHWWTFRLDGEPDVPPLKLLPNATLEAMVRTDTAGAERRYVLSGEVTVYEGENYILPRYAVRSARRQAPPAAPVESNSEGDSGTVRGGDGAQALEASTPDPTAVAIDASAEDVLAVLAAQEPGTLLMTPTRSDPVAGDLRSLTGAHPAMMDGTPLVRRPGRVVLDGRWWTFLVESENSEHPEPPMRLLPNQNLELMVQAVEANHTGVVFVVSGEILAYGGDNYVLARAVLRRADLGNLRK